MCAQAQVRNFQTFLLPGYKSTYVRTSIGNVVIIIINIIIIITANWFIHHCDIGKGTDESNNRKSLAQIAILLFHNDEFPALW